MCAAPPVLSSRWSSWVTWLAHVTRHTSHVTRIPAPLSSRTPRVFLTLPAIFRSASSATSSQAHVSSPPCLEPQLQPKPSRQVRQSPAAHQSPSTIISLLYTPTPAGDAALGSEIADDVWVTRSAAFNAAAIQPTSEAAVSMLIVAAFVATAGSRAFSAVNFQGFRFVFLLPAQVTSLQSIASISYASSAAYCNGWASARIPAQRKPRPTRA